MKAMHRAIDDAYKKKPFDYLLIDGPCFKGYIPPGEDKDFIEYECIPKGDATYLSIASASIIAKDYHTKLCKDTRKNLKRFCTSCNKDISRTNKKRWTINRNASRSKSFLYDHTRSLQTSY